jgi:hypothetical protein
MLHSYILLFPHIGPQVIQLQRPTRHQANSFPIANAGSLIKTSLVKLVIKRWMRDTFAL